MPRRAGAQGSRRLRLLVDIAQARSSIPPQRCWNLDAICTKRPDIPDGSIKACQRLHNDSVRLGACLRLSAREIYSTARLAFHRHCTSRMKAHGCKCCCFLGVPTNGYDRDGRYGKCAPTYHRNMHTTTGNTAKAARPRIWMEADQE